ncbi:hypothetical protein FRB99_004466, partial [Tulasnella sp. 403]
YEIFRNIFRLRLFPKLWASLTSSEEILTPHQTILLKSLDAFLQSKDPSVDPSLPRVLSEIHIRLSKAAQPTSNGIPPDVGVGLTQGQLVVDSRLPVLIEGICLTSQSLVSLLLTGRDSGGTDEVSGDVKTTRLGGDGDTVVDVSVDLLRYLDALLPRIILGKEQRPPHLPAPDKSPVDDLAGFSYIKRDLVRLLGTLCYDDRNIQDAIRGRGGIPLIMNMCGVDERTPYLREHALFTLRNLLHGNEENQAFVDEFKPMVNWDQTGNLI